MPDPSPPDRSHPLDRAVPIAVGTVGLLLLLLGGWRVAYEDPVVPLGPLPLPVAWGPRLMIIGVVLFAGACVLHRPRETPGALARLAGRLPPGVLFVGGAWLGYALAVKLLAFLSLLWVPHFDRPVDSIARLWVEPLCGDWDAAWYRSIAFDGYSRESTSSNVAFFPLFPLLVRAVAYVVRDCCWASWVVAHGALLGGLFGVYRLTRERLRDEESARWAVLLTLAWPFAFFLAAAYSESVFLCLTVWAFVAAERRRFWIAGLLGAGAAATRLTGLALLPALLLVPAWSAAAGESIAGTLRRELRARWPVLLVPGGTLAFFGYLQLRFGDFWANLHAAKAGWGRGPAKGGHDFFSAVGALFLASHKPFLLMYTVQLVTALALVPLARRLPRSHGWGYTVFVLGIALPGALSGLEAFGRYMIPALPLAWVAIPAAQRHPVRAAMVVLGFGLLQSLFLFLHTHGYWVT